MDTVRILMVVVAAYGSMLESQPPRMQDALDADRLVMELRHFPDENLSSAIGENKDPRGPQIDSQRQRIKAQLDERLPAAIPALRRGLHDPDVELRRRIAFYFDDVGTRPQWTPFRAEILPDLVSALKDPDARVRPRVAKALASMGPFAERAVPNLIALLADSDEASRAWGCLSLRVMGPAARAALPALRRALADPSPWVRIVARLAVDQLEQR